MGEQRKFVALFILPLLVVCSGIRISNKTYVELTGKAACIRRLNGTHQVGCTSEMKGNVGVVHYIQNSTDLDWLLTTGPNQPYAVLLNSLDFTLDNVNKLMNSGKVNGIMVIHTSNKTQTPIPPNFSPDSTCPGDPYGLYHGDSTYGNCKAGQWNKQGNSLFYRDFSFPIFILTNETEITYLIDQCYEKYNKPYQDGSVREYPLCSVELKDRMSGAKNSESCIRRTNTHTNLNPDTYCDPLADENVVTTIKGSNRTQMTDNNSIILATARLDSFSLFENVYPSADNHVTGIVGLLAVAEALGKFQEDFFSSKRDILFAFLNGEAFDYIGSSRMIYDMNRGKFPAKSVNREGGIHNITLENIHSIVEVNQLGHRDQNKLWIHRDPLSTSVQSEIDAMVDTITSYSAGLIDRVNFTQPLPPASTQKFLKASTTRQIPAVVVTDHYKEFTNKYYNSRFDVASTINADTDSTDAYNQVTEQATKLTEVASILAKSLYKMATGNEPPTELAANNMTVTHLLYCFLKNPYCNLFLDIIEPDNVNKLKQAMNTPYPFYVSVDTVSNHVTKLVKNLMFHFVGTEVDIAQSKCKDSKQNDKYYHYAWLQGPLINGTRKGHCIQSSTTTSEAKSPAFILDDYNWQSGEYSTWTESSWQTGAISIRIFLVPSKQLEIGTLLTGLIILLVSMATSYFINRKAHILFSMSPPSSS